MRWMIVFLIFIAPLRVLLAQFGYVADFFSNQVSIIDLSTNTAVGYVKQSPFTLGNPRNLLGSPDGTKVYVNTINPDAVFVIDPTTSTVVSQVSATGFPFSTPNFLAILPNGTKLYVTNKTGNNVSIINTAANAVVGYVNPGAFPFNQPTDIDVSPDGTKLYVTNTGSSTVSIINTATDTVIGYVNPAAFPFTQPFRVAFIDNTKAYATNVGGGSVSVINATTNTATGYVNAGAFPFAGPTELAISSNLQFALVVNLVNNTVNRIDTATDTTILNIAGAFNNPQDVQITPDDLFAYVTDFNDNRVAILDLTSNTETGSVDASIFPFIGPINIELSNAALVVPVVQPPIFRQATSGKNVFASQTEFFRTITWQMPVIAPGVPLPVQFRIYRDTALTNLVGTVLGNETLQFTDHNIQPNSPADTVVYITSVDANGVVSESAPIPLN